MFVKPLAQAITEFGDHENTKVSQLRNDSSLPIQEKDSGLKRNQTLVKTYFTSLGTQVVGVEASTKEKLVAGMQYAREIIGAKLVKYLDTKSIELCNKTMQGNISDTIQNYVLENNEARFKDQDVNDTDGNTQSTLDKFM